MSEILRMPEVAANTTDAVLATWVVPVGQAFATGDTIVTVETDKAIVDVEAEGEGVMLRHLVAEGTQVQVGSPIALLGAVGEVVEDIDAALAQLGFVAGQRPEMAHESHGATADSPGATAAGAPSADTVAPAEGEARRFSSPIARKLALEAGVELAELTGTGPGGRIRRRDVDGFLARRGAEAALMAPKTTSGHVAGRPAAPAAFGDAEYVDEPVSRIRRAIANRLTESVQTAPHFYLRGSARVDRLLALRQEINGGGTVRVSLNDLVVKAAARAHVLVPALNVIWTGDAVRRFARVDVALAIATDAGLVTPVIRGVDRLPIGELATATSDLIARAKARRLQQSELEGGTITVTNLGMLGVEDFSAIINPPQAAILAVGAARAEPVVTDGRVEVATVMRVTLSIDHRPVDGATAADWLRVFLGLLESPAQILI
jgi:pyruvate dehydrogenase E2 component (dihydrolipoyllysine-residue acetyltransferase)